MNKFYSIFRSYFSMKNHLVPICACYSTTPCIFQYSLQVAIMLTIIDINYPPQQIVRTIHRLESKNRPLYARGINCLFIRDIRERVCARYGASDRRETSSFILATMNGNEIRNGTRHRIVPLGFYSFPFFLLLPSRPELFAKIRSGTVDDSFGGLSITRDIIERILTSISFQTKVVLRD